MRAPLVVRSLVRKDNPWENIGEGEQILAFGLTGPVCPGAGPAGTLREATQAFGFRLRPTWTLGSFQSRIGALFRASAGPTRQRTPGIFDCMRIVYGKSVLGLVDFSCLLIMKN